MTREQFISNLSHWNSYLPLLWEALENTEGDVIELGIGDGSTLKLREYCFKMWREDGRQNRPLFSYESNLEWYKKFDHLNGASVWHYINYVGNNWDALHEHWAHLQTLANGTRKLGVLFSDEAPGEMRKYNISMFCNTAQVIIAHDAEPSNDGGYKYSLLKPLFKYSVLHEFPGASTAAFSNFIDVSKWVI